MTRVRRRPGQYARNKSRRKQLIASGRCIDCACSHELTTQRCQDCSVAHSTVTAQRAKERRAA